MRIGDFSKLAMVTIRLLRHYDEIGLLKPYKVNELTGYREYSVEQLPELNKIMLLKDLGIPLTQIKTYLDNHISLSQLKDMLKGKQDILLKEIDEANRALGLITNRLQMIEDDEKLPLHHIGLKRTEGLSLATVKRLVPHMREMPVHCLEMYRELYAKLAQQEVDVQGDEITFYYNDEYIEENLEVEVSVPVCRDEVTINKLNAAGLNYRTYESHDQVAYLIHKGPFQTIGHSAIELLKWAMGSGYQVDGILREIHLSGPAHTDGMVQKSPVVELQLPVRKK